MEIISSNETGPSSATSAVPDLSSFTKNSSDDQVAKTGSSTTVSSDKTAPVTDEKKVKDAAKKISDFIKTVSRDLEFSVDNATKKIVIKVKVRDSGEVVRQIPSEEALQIADSLDTLRGLIIREHV